MKEKPKNLYNVHYYFGDGCYVDEGVHHYCTYAKSKDNARDLLWRVKRGAKVVRVTEVPNADAYYRI